MQLRRRRRRKYLQTQLADPVMVLGGLLRHLVWRGVGGRRTLLHVRTAYEPRTQRVKERRKNMSACICRVELCKILAPEGSGVSSLQIDDDSMIQQSHP